jgi:hypothetical protein
MDVLKTYPLMENEVDDNIIKDRPKKGSKVNLPKIIISESFV